MPIADPEHQQAQRERHGAEIDLGLHATFVAAIRGDERLVQRRQAVNL